MGSIKASVGKGGKNLPADVQAVQELLHRHASALKFAKPKSDGKCGSDTVKAIEAFQQAMGMKSPDGRVDPGGKTLAALDSRTTPKPPEDKEPKGTGATKPGKVKGNLSGVQRDIVDFVTAVAAFYGRDISISSGKRSAADQGRVMFENWTGNLKRGRLYKHLSSNPKLLKELDELYDKATGRGSDAAASKARFVQLCADEAPKLSLHVAGRAIDVSPKSCMTTAMREAMKTGLREIEERSCYHYDTTGSVPAVTDALTRRWKAP